MKPVIWALPAENDLKEIADYIAEDRPAAAYRTLVRIKAAADSLTHNPEIGREGRVKGTRELILHDLPYILPYRVTDNSIQILAVMHAARKWPDGF